MIQHQPWSAQVLSKLDAEHRERFTWVRCVVRETIPAHPARFVLPPDAGNIRVLARRLGLAKHFDRAGAGNDYAPISKADPLISVAAQQLVADGPIIRFVLAPVGMDLLFNLMGQPINQASHGIIQSVSASRSFTNTRFPAMIG